MPTCRRNLEAPAPQVGRQRSQDGRMMKRTDGRTGFWKAGFSIFADELTKTEKARLGPLQVEFKATTDPSRRDELNREIVAVKTDFKAKRKNARYSLFAKT
jgi:hypothetical protein